MLAQFFKLIFSIPIFQKHYYGFYKHLFLKKNLFKGIIQKSYYDKDIQMNLRLDDFIQQQIYFLGYYDKAGILFLKKYLLEGSVFVDVGANIGAFSFIAAKLVGNNGKVFCFEPVSAIFNQLQENIQLNSYRNMMIEKIALFNENTNLELKISKETNLGMSSIFNHDEEKGNCETAKAIKGDDYFSLIALSKIDLIKMDIEGAELFALQGLQETLKKFKPFLFLELNEQILSQTKISKIEITSFLTDLGYVMKGINQQGCISTLDSSNLNDSENFIFIHKENTAHKNYLSI